MSLLTIWGPPNSGKTTLAIDLAFALSKGGQSVCLISPEPYSELSAKLNIRIPKEKSLSVALRNPEGIKQIVYRLDDLLFILAHECEHDVYGEEADGKKAKEMLEQAKEVFDIVVVDCPSHAGSVLAAWAMNLANQVLVLSGAQSASLTWMRANDRAMAAIANRHTLICTEVSRDFDYRSLFQMLGSGPAIRFPYIRDAETIQTSRRTLYESGGRSGRDYTKAMDDLCDMLEEGGNL